MSEGACSQPSSEESDTRGSYYGNEDYENYPVIWVNWPQSQAYCEWAGGRLPTEEEWEKAARGTDGRMYPWGNESPTCTLANYRDCVRDTSEVGSYPAGASPYGALDMAGNVLEWVADYRPVWVLDAWHNDDGRIYKGSSWNTAAYYVHIHTGFWDAYWVVRDSQGFRCVMESQP